MVDRCTNARSAYWKYYGGRGITVCDRWRKFENFLTDMGERPDGLTLERKKNHLGYDRANCCWATRLEQVHNRRPMKLTPEQVLAIRADPRKLKTIAADYGISFGMVGHIKTGRAHRHV